MEIAIIAAVVVFLILVYFVYRFIRKKKAKGGADKKEGKPKKVKVKKEKVKKVKNKNALDLKSSGVNKVDKFLYRKELKVLVLISKILPKGYIAFPKIGVNQIIQPVGSPDLFNLVKNNYIDIVIFDEVTMQPKVAIDIYDGSIGDEQLDVVIPELLEAFKLAELPLVSIRVKTEYSQEELKNPIYSALGLNTEESKEENISNNEEKK